MQKLQLISEQQKPEGMKASNMCDVTMLKRILSTKSLHSDVIHFI